MKKLVVATLVALTLVFAPLPVTAADGMVWVWIKPTVFDPSQWVQNTSYSYPACDTEEAGADDGFVRCSIDQPTDDLGEDTGWDPMTAHAPVSILD